MDLDFTDDQLEFRDQVRTWLDENKPVEPRPRDHAGIREYDLAWQRTQWEGGWAGITWPTEYGRQGLPRDRRVLCRVIPRRADPNHQGHRKAEVVSSAENPARRSGVVPRLL